MGRIVLSMMVSIDGFIEATDDVEEEWVHVDAELHHFINDMTARAELLLYGRKVYEVMIPYWPDAAASSESPDYEVEFGKIWVDKPKVVFSTTLQDPGYNTRVVAADAVGEARKLKAEIDGELLLFGGGEIATTLVRAGLLDEVRLFVQPEVLGDGTPLFGTPVSMRTLDTKTFGSGVTLLRMEPLPAS